MEKTVDMVMVNECGIERTVVKIFLSGAYEPKDKEIFTIDLYTRRLPAIYLESEEGNGKITILHGNNGLPRKEIMGYVERVNDFDVLKELL